VLSQIAVPHDYYFREMYLPQLTTGPAALAFMPDSRTLVYSMQGSLWRQAIDSTTAEQLTAGPGYDYQPDVSPDGDRVVFARYDGKAVELQILDLESGTVRALTTGGAVNLEPRWSPDGQRIAYVSTARNGRFDVFVGRPGDNDFQSTPLLDERKSETARYYYSEFDHSLSPAWTPDGKGILLVRNPETPYGTGSLWLHPVDGGKPTLVRQEETSWKARPDIAPDGKRVVYASYLGRQWHQLWVTRIGSNAEPFPLTYGDFDATSARWSPDGSRIAYIVNESGNTSIRILETVGGARQDVPVGERKYKVPHGVLKLKLVDAAGKPVSGRVSVLAADGRSYAPASHWMHGDDGFDRNTDRVEPHYFHMHGEASLQLPAGTASVTVWRGPENAIAQHTVDIDAARDSDLTVRIERLDLPNEWREWQSGDVHIHMNYGGQYRNTPARLVQQATAEDLDVAFNLIVNKEQRIPDISYFQPEPDAASNDDVLVVHAQEFHTSHWGHQGLLGLKSHLLIPDYVAYPGTAAASLYPDNATIAELARKQGAIVGYVHPYLAPAPDPVNAPKLTHAFPADAALGLVDYFEVVGFADHRSSAEVWYRLMNCGLRIPAAGGTDAMANYASLRGPLGVNRSYVRVPEPASDPAARRDAWLAGLAAGHSFATNGPLLGFSAGGRGPGEEVAFADGEHTIEYAGFMRSAVPIDHVEVVHNGRVVDSVELAGNGTTADFAGTVTVRESGWLLLRAWSERSHRLVFDLYPYATTTPVWISVGGRLPTSQDDAEYFLAWVRRLHESAANHPDYNSDAERAAILARFDAASERFEACR
jgi:TolB protein